MLVPINGASPATSSSPVLVPWQAPSGPTRVAAAPTPPGAPSPWWAAATNDVGPLSFASTQDQPWLRNQPGAAAPEPDPAAFGIYNNPNVQRAWNQITQGMGTTPSWGGPPTPAPGGQAANSAPRMNTSVAATPGWGMSKQEAKPATASDTMAANNWSFHPSVTAGQAGGGTGAGSNRPTRQQRDPYQQG